MLSQKLVRRNWCDGAVTSDSEPVQSAVEQFDSKTKIKKGRYVMASMDLGSLPFGNPCAQCGKPIAAPEWIESEPGHTAYLWHCWVCDYRFEAVAYYEDAQQGNEALAA
jgi:hypothetical protein